MSREFDWIARHFRPLAEAAEAGLRLSDDAAVLAAPTGADLVLTADAMVAGVHFMPQDPPGSISRKLLRVNLSDLAAMGARPLGYLLTVTLPAAIEESWIEGFARGLAEDQREYGVALLGGDTTRTSGPICLSVSAIGQVPAGRALRRSTARPGDLVCVSGTIGDAALALKDAEGLLGPELEKADRAFLRARLDLPHPRLTLGHALLESGLATAAIDVSDGLAADLGHIAEESALAAEIRVPELPLSESARRALAAAPSLVEDVLSGGDDYELLFTVEPHRRDELAALAIEAGVQVTPIGVMKPGRDVTALDREGKPIALQRRGWSHF